jgi:hypothetical protein
MPRTRKPRLGSYAIHYYGEKVTAVNGTVRKYRRWRKRRMRMQRESLRRNR